MKYSDSGVNIDAAMRALARSKEAVRSTWDARVRNEIGAFGGLYQPTPGGPLLVASVDGVGTKVMIARMAGVYDTVGRDLVNHCVDDILVQGAEPLFFLDYFATAKLDEAILPQVISGFAAGCRDNGCAPLGGETAEMPGVCGPVEFDLAGTIVGQVDPDHVIDGSVIAAGDRIWGLPSSGLHTNGYSLARKVVFEQAGLKLEDTPDELEGTTVADALLAVHVSYLKPVRAFWAECGHSALHGMAHITGGGFTDNIPRVLPDGLCARIDTRSWGAPGIFRLLQERGSIDAREMHRVFNMGIGMVLFTGAEGAACLEKLGAMPIGEVTRDSDPVILEF